MIERISWNQFLNGKENCILDKEYILEQCLMRIQNRRVNLNLKKHFISSYASNAIAAKEEADLRKYLKERLLRGEE